MKEFGLTKAIVQQKANQLVRELHAIEESEEMMRMLEERRSRAVAKKQGYDKSLAECHAKKVPSSKRSSSGGGIQTGLKAFFVPSKSAVKKQKVLENGVDSPASAFSATGKRKDASESSDESPSKKTKTTSTFKVVPGKRSCEGEPMHGTPEKKLRTIVNEDGVIELVSVPR